MKIHLENYNGVLGECNPYTKYEETKWNNIQFCDNMAEIDFTIKRGVLYLKLKPY